MRPFKDRSSAQCFPEPSRLDFPTSPSCRATSQEKAFSHEPPPQGAWRPLWAHPGRSEILGHSPKADIRSGKLKCLLSTHCRRYHLLTRLVLTYVSTANCEGQMLKILAVAALLLTTIAAQTPNRSLAPGQGLRPLTDAEMKALLPGSYIREIVPAHLDDLSTDEQFNRDGTHVRFTDNREVEGHYAIKNGKICVENEINQKYCRIFAVDKTGHYFKGSPTYLVPVSIQRLRVGASAPSVHLH